MLSQKTCPECGVQLPADSPHGLCPKCLFLGGVSTPAHQADPTAEIGLESGAAFCSSVGSEKVGDRIGRYKLLQELGEGGCGTVYMAEQEEPVRRKVALKVIKLGMDTKQVVARFEAERQALALMDHPNIAKVLDAGSTETGRPYFVMELVQGRKITQYCDEERLSTRLRLDLFIEVCQAVQHAHQKGIIHRDLKPSNILVAERDGVLVPKVIDFGIAKATSDIRLTDKTLFTAFEQFIGTPAYMSPEQAKLSGVDIDTRSDIYSLGVLLYDLLTGKTPFEPRRLMEAGFDEIRRIIRETEPAKPSTRLSELGGPDLAATARARQSDPPKLISLVRGDLDWIVMKALEKDRNRRYDTASGLAMDIQRHLDDEPIVARPPSNFYRFQKLARRQKFVFAAGGSIFAALIIGLAVATFFFFRERREHKRAVEAEKDALAAGLESFRVASSLQLRSGGQLDWTNTVPALVKAAGGWTRERIRRELHDRPELQADLLHFLGHAGVYMLDESASQTLSTSESGDFSESALTLRASLLRESLLLYQQVHGPDHPFVAEVLNDLASDPSLSLEEAEGYARKALAMRKKLLDPQGLEVAESLAELANVLSRQTNKSAIAEGMLLEALAIRTNHLRPEALGVARLYSQLAGFQESRNDLAAAERSLGYAVLSGGDWFANIYGVSCRLRLASLLRKRGSLLEAEDQCRRALEISRACLPELPGLVEKVLERLSLILSERGKLAEAEDRAREFLDLSGRRHPQDWRTFNGQSKLGALLMRQKKYTEAEPLLIAGYEGLDRRNNDPKIEFKLPLEKASLEEACERLVQLYTAWDKPAQAAEWNQRLADMKQAGQTQTTTSPPGSTSALKAGSGKKKEASP